MQKKIKFMVLLGVLVIWWIASGFVNKLFLPSPPQVLKALIETLKSGLLIKSFFGSFWRITIATCYSGIMAILIASLVVNSKTLEKIIVPITATSRYIPVTVFYPLLIMWLGIGETMKITFLFLFFNFYSFSQEITLKGKIFDQQNRGIQSASVSLLDESEDILGYNFSDEEGEYSITFQKPKTGNITIELSCLGYHKISKIISL